MLELVEFLELALRHGHEALAALGLRLRLFGLGLRLCGARAPLLHERQHRLADLTDDLPNLSQSVGTEERRFSLKI